MEPPRPEARERAARAAALLHDCRLCAWDCGVDRRTAAGIARARCHAGTTARIFHRDVEWAGEAELVPTAVISFSGCNWRCRFCLTGRESQDARAGLPADPAAIGAWLAARPELRSVTILGGEPAIHLPTALELIAHVPRALPVVWKTNASALPVARDLLDGQVQVVLADAKFGNDSCGNSLAGAPDSRRVVRDHLRWAAQRSRLIVRHLLMPGHLACCTIPVLEELARDLPGCAVSLMTGFLPAYGAADMGSNSAADIAAARAVLAQLPLQPVPWRAVATADDTPRRDDELWLAPDGRVCVDGASPEVLAVLRRLADEVTIGP